MISVIKKLFAPSSSSRAQTGVQTCSPGTILFVDDEPEVRKLARVCLEQAGYKMIEADDGQKAVELFQAEREQIGLVVTDVLMPRLDGLGLATHLHKEDPELPILLLSGHMLEEDLWAEGNARLRYLMKPYRLQDLASAVMDLVGPAPQPSVGT